MVIYDIPLFELDRDDVATMGQYKMHESKQMVIVMSSQHEYEKHIGTAVIETQIAIMRALVRSYM